MNRTDKISLSFASLLLLGGAWLMAPVRGDQPVPSAFGLPEEDIAWLEEAARKQLSKGRVQADNGAWIFTPDGTGHYGAQWTRDFYYMVQYAGDLLDPGEVKAAIRFTLAGQRDDGCIPDRVNAAGQAIYSPGAPGSPLADHALDNGPFMALLVCSYVEQTGDLDFLRETEPALRRGLDHVRRGDDGLVFNDPQQPQCVYGFSDVVKKTGRLLFCSLLYFDACDRLANLCDQAACGAPDEYRSRAASVRSNLKILWDEQAGMFLAADQDCRQIDLWGSALAVELGLVGEEQAGRVADYFVANQAEILLRGQVRHLPKSAGPWQKLFRPCPVETYQNGAYWATPLAWVVPVLERRDPTLAAKVVGGVVRDFRENGINECINADYLKLPNLVVSATNVYSLVRTPRPGGAGLGSSIQY